MANLTREQIEAVRRINKDVVNADGTIKSFKEQLLEYEYGYYNARSPFVLSPGSGAILQSGANDYPITMSVSSLIKLKSKHDLEYKIIAELPEIIIEKNVLILDSYTYTNGGLCMYLDINGNNDIPLFAAFHLNERAAEVSVNGLKSVYERKNIEYTITKTWEEGLKLYPNEKTENWLQSNGLRLPADLASLLNGNNRAVSKHSVVSVKDSIARPEEKDNAFEKYFSGRITPDKEKGQALERLSGIRFSGCYSNLEPNKILRRPSCVVNEELSKQQEGQKLIARLQEIGFSSNAELYMPYVFEYQGYHFVPAGALPADWTRDKMQKTMRTHLLTRQEPHLSAYDKSTPGRENDISYSLLDFYKASGLTQADVFKCIETGKTYIPGENELFGYTGEYIEVVPDPIDTSVRYGIYVINDATPSREYRFMGMDYLEKNGVVVQPQDYSLVYRGKLWSDGTLDSLYTRFNTDPPKDYAGPSMSVSDVIVVQKGGNAKAYFVDRIGFKELPDFVEQRPQGELSRELGMVLDEPAAERKDIVLNGTSRSSRSRDDVSL